MIWVNKCLCCLCCLCLCLCLCCCCCTSKHVYYTDTFRHKAIPR